MALSSAIVWEIRSNGNLDNGGGFRTGATGTDHSQQDAAWSTRADIVIDGADNTKITSAADPFAADDVGNLLKITAGVGFTTGWFEVIAHAAGVATVDRAIGVVASTGGAGKLGGACTLVDAVLDTGVDGNTTYIANDGAYAPAALSPTNNGSPTLPRRIIGYDTVRDDEPAGTDRPLIAMGANGFLTGTHYRLTNLRFTTTNANGIDLSNECLVFNCAVQNTSGTAGRKCVDLGTSARAVNCELYGTNGANDARGVTLTTDSRFMYCYLHDLSIGALAGSDNLIAFHNIFDDCTTGLAWYTSGSESEVMGNTFYGCVTAVNISGGEDEILVMANILSTSTTGVAGVAGAHILDFNIWHNNGTDITGSAKGPSAINADPLFNNPAAGDFTLQSGSPALGAWFPAVATGLAAELDFNIGVAQNDPDTGGGGGGGGWW